VLESAAPDLECWTFFEAPSPLAFWARRQAHETTIHRVDAQLAAAAAAGESTDVPGSADPVPPELAADGIDELLMGFGRQVKPEGPLAEPILSVAIRTTSADSAQATGVAPEGGCWLVRMGRDKVEPLDISRGSAIADCAVAGPAAEVYLMLWNRRPADGIDLRGDDSLLGVLRRELRITWH
jgi:MDMPI C-terminal domain